VIGCQHGGEALEYANQDQPDLILSDVMMPVMDGIALVAALKNDKRLTSVPVILISARAGDEAKTEALGLGVVDYIVKPFNAKELVAKVFSHVTRY
jgi:DNA-binding response OmpR family regulator